MVRPYDGSPTSLQDLETYFPDDRPDPPPDCFEIAISSAGGTSTGAYIGGVLDFIIEALNAYAAAQAADPQGTPTHKVRVVNLTGTSAGGLSSALASLYTVKQFPHVYHEDKWAELVAAGIAHGDQSPQLNPLYRAWVQEVDMTKLLAKPTAADTEISIFASAPSAIRGTVFDMITGQPDAAWPAWAQRPLDLRITVGNLRGVPYSLTFENQPGGRVGEHMTMHRDHVAFAVSPQGELGAPDAHELAGVRFNQTDAWTLFGCAAVASSAIPVVFAPVPVAKQDPVVYQWRDCYYDGAIGAPRLDQPAWIAPAPAPYSFTATDGGVFDDAPFELAHRVLAGVRGTNNRDGLTANRAVILVAPIVNERIGNPTDPVLPPPDGPTPAPGEAPSTPLGRLMSAVKAMVFSPIDQCRLSAFDLALAKADDVFSRYIIAPSRNHPDPAKSGVMLGPSRSLMSLPLEAAMGFAAQPYRHHDFLLGRRNAQKFLAEQFVLPAGNPLIANGRPEPGDAVQAPDPRTGAPTTYYPIIPLRGAAARRFEEPLPAWTWQALDNGSIANLVSMFGARVDAMWDKVKSSLLAGTPQTSFWAGLGQTLGNTFLAGPVAWAAWTFKLRPMLVNGFKDLLNKARAQLDPAGPYMQ